jgi:uncharacterized protein YdaU (DUF1376 family)
MNFYPFHIGDYATATRHLTPMEDLAYRRLLDYYYANEKLIPLDISSAARLINMRDHEVEVKVILTDFFSKEETGYRQKRCDVEIAKYQKKAKSAQNAINSRWKDHVPKGKNDGPPGAGETGNTDGPQADQSATGGDGSVEKKAPTASKAKKDEAANIADMLIDVDQQTVTDWQAQRKVKKAPITQTVINEVKHEAEKAGLTLDEAIKYGVKRNWVAFDAAWWLKDNPPAGAQAKQQSHFSSQVIAPASRHAGFGELNYNQGVTADGRLL